MSKNKNLFISEKTKALKELAPTTNEIVSVNNKEVKDNKQYLTIEEVAKKFGCSIGEATKRIKELNINYVEERKVNGGRGKRYYDFDIIEQSFQKHEQERLNKIALSGEKLSNSKDERVVGTAFLNNFSNSNIVEQAKSLSILFNSFTNNLNCITEENKSQKERIKELEEQLVLFEVTKEQLEKSQSTIENLENTIKLVIEGKRKDFTVREIRTTIINSIKYRCWKEHLEHREFTNKVYATFFNRHNFSYEFKQQFYATKPHISFIEDKDLLIEILEITKE